VGRGGGCWLTVATAALKGAEILLYSARAWASVSRGAAAGALRAALVPGVTTCSGTAAGGPAPEHAVASRQAAPATMTAARLIAVESVVGMAHRLGPRVRIWRFLCIIWQAEARMPSPRRVARWNKAGLNRITRPAAPWMPGFGLVVHRGRRSGREYQTPVNVFPADDGFIIALTYGADTDWVKNVQAAGGCELRTRGRVLRVGS